MRKRKPRAGKFEKVKYIYFVAKKKQPAVQYFCRISIAPYFNKLLCMVYEMMAYSPFIVTPGTVYKCSSAPIYPSKLICKVNEMPCIKSVSMHDIKEAKKRKRKNQINHQTGCVPSVLHTYYDNDTIGLVSKKANKSDILWSKSFSPW